MNYREFSLDMLTINMYTSVHMTQIISITEVRKNIFALVDKVAKTGEEIEVEREGRRVVKLVAIKDDPAARAKYVLEHVLPKLAGSWKNMTKKELREMEAFRRGKKEKLYWKRKRFKW
ncbi:hypothetical protein A2954_01240 [Candidatus Roizmanbacteria bacterium RIFCSPLOWO2_01_FULL_37_12]|uniref:Antitoxin n=1 Tax=Candidatus Roizmanbacteria bacterium RIFCSPLOWO2_01_FULL_37_12 TaxID=1802056 RepID=A0A1F7IGG1_9BACT|nr:MAG: hypothetical protein A2954_01240 [Candidatus Roizmanbacteria bacterium RIFCSPLOWO2_01_FULL_37_12]